MNQYAESEQPCDVCGHEAGFCICPDCPVCHSHGDPECYRQHGMHRNKQQCIGRAQLEIDRLEEKISDEQVFIDSLFEKPDDWREPSLQLP